MIRCFIPGLGIETAGSGGFKGEVNMHVSVRDETRPWEDVADECRRYRLQHALDQMTRMVNAEIPDPLL